MEINFKIAKIITKKFHNILSMLCVVKDTFSILVNKNISLLLSIQYSAHGANALLCSQHGFTYDIFPVF